MSPILHLRSESVLIVKHCWRLHILGAQKHQPKLVGELGEGRYDSVLWHLPPRAHLLRLVGIIFHVIDNKTCIKCGVLELPTQA